MELEGRWGGSLVGWKGLESSNILLSFPNRLARVPRVEDKRGLMNAPNQPRRTRQLPQL